MDSRQRCALLESHSSCMLKKKMTSDEFYTRMDNLLEHTRTQEANSSKDLEYYPVPADVIGNLESNVEQLVRKVCATNTQLLSTKHEPSDEEEEVLYDINTAIE